MNCQQFLSDTSELVNTALDRLLIPADHLPLQLHEAIRYSMFAGGKRLRPALVIAGAEAVGGSRHEVLPIACALEMIHTFSLIHDDLPAMDDDDLRRGRPTNHKVYGEATAILAGDALLAHAFEVLALMGRETNPQVILAIILDIAAATGSLGMVGGQVLDMQAEGKKISYEELVNLHRRKTGKLITVAVVSGAKAAGATETQITDLTRYGECLGLAFQIADDILDIEGGEALGKDIGSDAARGKSTYPALLGMERAKAEAIRAKDEALVALKNFGLTADILRVLAAFVVERKS